MNIPSFRGGNPSQWKFDKFEYLGFYGYRLFGQGRLLAIGLDHISNDHLCIYVNSIRKGEDILKLVLHSSGELQKETIHSKYWWPIYRKTCRN